MVIAAASLRIALALALIALASVVQGELVIVKEGTTLYHRPGCPVIRDGAGVVAMTVAQAESRGLKPHLDCDPSKAPELAAGTRGANGRMRTPAKPPAAVYVFVDAVGTQYHRERCPKLGKNPKTIGLDAAAKSYWPCPVCRPPIRARKRYPRTRLSGDGQDEQTCADSAKPHRSHPDRAIARQGCNGP